MSHEFKVGDIVECISPAPEHGLHTETHHKIIALSSMYDTVQLETLPNTFWDQARFRVVFSQKIAPLQRVDLRIKDFVEEITERFKIEEICLDIDPE